jgi:hypothetical protein
MFALANYFFKFIFFKIWDKISLKYLHIFLHNFQRVTWLSWNFEFELAILITGNASCILAGGGVPEELASYTSCAYVFVSTTFFAVRMSVLAEVAFASTIGGLAVIVLGGKGALNASPIELEVVQCALVASRWVIAIDAIWNGGVTAFADTGFKKN